MTMTERSADLGHASSTTTLSQLVARLSSLLSLWRRRTVTRFELARLDERMLRDIGVTHGAVELEVSKPFWRA
ncbi:DUF1127 domain-containing protein [Azospirillum sp. SYSU D00513]|uniref:DUF1127 domain-containing protein n=1 Tax=Azospirillum sp. SYSU D00513 TaxID=2812561 RepID=UPI001A96B4D1|nr:DUF1127 domain-containing protein [Azospirillum sp. SYSU D00513]